MSGDVYKQVQQMQAQFAEEIVRETDNLLAGDIMTARIKELETELAELKASIPKIKHDAIVKMQRASNAVVTANCRCNSLNDHDEFAYKYAKNILTQAKDEAE